MSFKKLLFTAATAALLCVASGAGAAEFQPKAKSDVLVNLRVTGVLSDEDAPISTSGGAATGLKAEVNDDYRPTVGLSYFVTDNVAVELILGTTKHQVKAVGPGTDVNVHETWVLPPVLSAQYHFMPERRFSPYVGAGVNYMVFYNGEDQNGFSVDLDDGFGYAVQAGADVALHGPYSLNVDVKKVFFETDATINGGALKAEVDLNPWVVSVGVGRKF
jgi:outer membrane protein